MKDFLLTLHNHIPRYHHDVKKRISLVLFSRLRTLFLCLVPLLIALLIIILSGETRRITQATSSMELMSLPIAMPEPALYPKLQTPAFSMLSAQAAEILDSDSGVVLYAKNPTARFSMASTTKIMTALTALDYYDMDDVITVMSTNIPPVVVGFPKNESVRFEDMLYAMLLPSGNDAAQAIADNYPGGRQAFIQKMNEKATELHMGDTHFTDSNGLDERDVTTARDLSRLAAIAMKNPVFARVVSTRTATITNTSHTNQYHLENINKLLGVEGVDGIKTGFTDEAGQVLVSSKLEQGHRIIMVVMRSTDRFGDTNRLLDGIRDAISYIKF